MNAISSPPFVSVFESVFDTVVFGAGFAGLSAARTLAAQGCDTLLVESSGDLLWEATRALENSAVSEKSDFGWDDWLGELGVREGANDRFFDSALAEIITAHTLSSAPANLQTLLYAAPIALETEAGRVIAVTVATKSGPRRLRAHRWIDATETGVVARLAKPDLAPRLAEARHRSLVLHSLQTEKIDAALPLLAEKHADLEWFASVRTSERRLRWSAESAAPAWYLKVPALVADLRAILGTTPAAGAGFIVSHCAMNDFPVYAAGSPDLSAGLPANLCVASPALRGERLASPADRFALGAHVAATLPARTADTVTWAQAPVAALPLPAFTKEAHDVLVAGAGTGGAVAAIAAGRNGARALVIEFSPYPGGVGTGAGICGYFHGAKGGLQSEIDLRTQEMTALLTGLPAGLNSWHHDAKKIVLLSLFDQADVTFSGEVLLTGVERDAGGRVLAALAVVGGRLARLPAAAFIDATGDGDLAFYAGAEFAFGRPGDARTLAYSQSVFSLTTKENQLGLRSSNFDSGWVDPTDPEDLSRARLVGIGQHLQPLWTQPDRPVAVTPLLGLRQSRQIETDAKISMTDLVGGAHFDDSIGEVETVADTHSVDYEFESDELAFYYWACRGFRHALRSELPYRMLLPRGLANVWVACRAAGIDVDAAYGLRMQREMQRLGEAAGIAAALAVSEGTDARGIDFTRLQEALGRSGAIPADRLEDSTPSEETLLAALDKGLPGVYLWHLFRQAAPRRAAVSARLTSPDRRVSFYAAVLLALWDDGSAEPRLVEALLAKEDGPSPEERPVPGAHAQCIDLPFWLQAVVWLRRVGTVRCLPALRALAATPAQPLNVRTILALTLERLADRLGAHEELISALGSLLADEPVDAQLPPSRSLWRTLHGEVQRKLINDRGAPVAQDHRWQLHLIIGRTRKRLGLVPLAASAGFVDDPRAYVRKAFAG